MRSTDRDSARASSGLRQKLNKSLTQRDLAQASLTRQKQELLEAEKNLEAATLAQQHLQALAQSLQTQAHKQIAQAVSTCLNAVFTEFEEPYGFSIHFERRRGKTEARFLLERRGRTLSPGTISGGVRAVVSVALRIARLSLHRPSSRKLLCLDEPFRGLSRQNLRKMNSLIETLARDLGFQIVLVTHDEEISCGKVISI